jgi:hypothetical protein
MHHEAGTRDAREMTDKSKAIESVVAQIEKQFDIVGPLHTNDHAECSPVRSSTPEDSPLPT